MRRVAFAHLALTWCDVVRRWTPVRFTMSLLLLLRQQRKELLLCSAATTTSGYLPYCVTGFAMVLAPDLLPLLTFYRLYCHHCVLRVRPFPALAVGVGTFPRHRMTTPLGVSDPGGRLPPIWSCAQLPTGREALAYTLNAPSCIPAAHCPLGSPPVVGCWALPMTWSLVLPMIEERTRKGPMVVVFQPDKISRRA